MRLADLPDGMHFDVPPDVYYEPDVSIFSQSAAKSLLRTPRHYRAWLEGPERRSPALDFGKAGHMALLEPARFAETYVVEPDFGDLRAVSGRTSTEEGRANKARRDDWRKRYAGAIHLPADDYRVIVGVARFIREEHDLARNLLVDGRYEVTLLWHCAETGVRCKARLDCWLDDILVMSDLKFLEDAGEEAFQSCARRYGYRRQAWHYLDGVETVLRARGTPGEPRKLFVCGEKEPPYAVDVHELDPQALADGRSQIMEARRRLATALETGDWPAYGTDIKTVGLARWETITNGG